MEKFTYPLFIISLLITTQSCILGIKTLRKKTSGKTPTVFYTIVIIFIGLAYWKNQSPLWHLQAHLDYAYYLIFISLIANSLKLSQNEQAKRYAPLIHLHILVLSFLTLIYSWVIVRFFDIFDYLGIYLSK